MLVTSTEDAHSPYCAAQDALIRCVISLTAGDAAGAVHRVRLLTPQVRVWVGVGGGGLGGVAGRGAPRACPNTFRCTLYHPSHP